MCGGGGLSSSEFTCAYQMSEVACSLVNFLFLFLQLEFDPALFCKCNLKAILVDWRLLQPEKGKCD